jgi:peptide chain release factor subunit 1
MDTRRFAELASPAGSLISMYVDRTAGPSTTVVNDLVKTLKTAAEGAERTAAQSIREDIDQIKRIAATADTSGDPAWMVLASHADGILVYESLSCCVSNWVEVGQRPYLRPLRALPEPIETVLFVVERPKVVVYRVGETMSEVARTESDLSKSDYGGFQGYEEAKATRRADEEASRVWKEAIASALDGHQSNPFDLVVVAGHKHDLEPFAEHLHSYLVELPIEKMVIDPRTATEADLTQRVRELEPAVARARDERTIRSVLEAAYQGRPVARGTAAVLTAANMGAVDRLVVSGPFAKTGVRCVGCGWLARAGERCPSCDQPFEPIPDVVGAAAERVIEQGGHFDQVVVASALDVDGVAALLRFPLPA